MEMDQMKTRDKILLAALDLFSERGYDEASIDLIAEAVGIKGPSIYAHYKGKEDILNSLIAMMEQRYDEIFGCIMSSDKVPESLDEFREDCLRHIEFIMRDTQIKKIRRFCAKEQYRDEKIAALTSKHQLTGNREMYAVILEKMMDKGLIRRFDSRLLALELISPVTLLLGIADREPFRTNEMLTQMEEHLAHFIIVYGIEN